MSNMSNMAKFMMSMNGWACFSTADNDRSNVIDKNKNNKST